MNVRHQSIFVVYPVYISWAESLRGTLYQVLNIAFQEMLYWPQEMVSVIASSLDASTV